MGNYFFWVFTFLDAVMVFLVFFVVTVVFAWGVEDTQLPNTIARCMGPLRGAREVVL